MSATPTSLPTPNAAFPPYGPSIDLNTAVAIVDEGIAAARRMDREMVVSVVDPAGHLLALKRMDRAHLASVDVSVQKARCASLYRRPTKVFHDAASTGAGAGAGVLSLPGVLALEGGIPLVKDGQLVGAVGVSGGTPVEDGQVAASAARVLV